MPFDGKPSNIFFLFFVASRVLSGLKGLDVLLSLFLPTQRRTKWYHLFPHHPFEAKEIQVHSQHTHKSWHVLRLPTSLYVTRPGWKDNLGNELFFISASKDTKGLNDPGNVFLGTAFCIWCLCKNTVVKMSIIQRSAPDQCFKCVC